MIDRKNAAGAYRPPRSVTGFIAFYALPAVVFAWFVAGFLFTADGILDFTGYPIGRDFAYHWTAGRLAVSGRGLEIFDVETYLGVYTELFEGATRSGYWPYPPHALLVMVPVALLPYPWALALWSASGLALYLATAGRRMAIVLAPATLVNLAFGQTGFIIAAALIGGFAMIGRRPVLAGIVLGFVSIKPHLGMMIPVALVAARAWPTLASACVSAAAMIALSGFAFGWEAWQAWWVDISPVAMARLEPSSKLFTLMMPSAFTGGRILGLSAEHAYFVQALFTAFAAWATYRAVRREGPTENARAVFLLASAIATPYILCYDLPLIVPAVLLMIERGRREGFRRGELFLWYAVWVLPFAVLLLNAATLPLGAAVLSAGLCLAMLRLERR